MKEFNKAVSVPTYKEKVALGLSDEERIRRCYEINKDSQCFRERNGYSLCVLCPKNEEKTEKTTEKQKLKPSRLLTTARETEEKRAEKDPEKLIAETPKIPRIFRIIRTPRIPRTPSAKTSVPEIPLDEIISYISEITERADVSGETQKLATEILRQAKEKDIFFGQKDIKGFAAAILWIACQQTNERKRHEEIAEAARVSQSTLNNHCWYLRLKLGLPKPKRRRHKRAN